MVDYLSLVYFAFVVVSFSCSAYNSTAHNATNHNPYPNRYVTVTVILSEKQGLMHALCMCGLFFTWCTNMKNVFYIMTVKVEMNMSFVFHFLILFLA